jgi:hypothetical protein
LQQRKQRKRLKRRSRTRQAARSYFRVVYGENVSGTHIDDNRRAGSSVHDAGEFSIQIARIN